MKGFKLFALGNWINLILPNFIIITSAFIHNNDPKLYEQQVRLLKIASGLLSEQILIWMGIFLTRIIISHTGVKIKLN